jgi:very-short-patch-repair endonuclease
VVSLGELADLGLGPRGVQHRADAGHLHRLFDGVYAVGHPGVAVDGRRRAAVLACGAGAALSHRSAAALWGLCPDETRHWHVTVPRSGRVAPPGIVLHTSRAVTPDDVSILRHVCVTTPAWTLVDLAGVLSADRLERAFQEAEVLGLLDVEGVLDALSRCRGRRGTGRVRRLLAVPSAGVARSELEARFLRLCRAGRLPRPRLNAAVDVGGRSMEVDVLWAEQRVVVELDGARFHRTRRGFEADRRRDAALVAAGFVVVRLTWRRVTTDAREVLDELRRVLVLRGGQL